MIEWLAGTSHSDDSVPIAQWSTVLEHELRAEMLLCAEQSFGIDFVALPSATIPSEFEAPFGRDNEACSQALLETIFNFVGALRLPAAANRFLFIVAGQQSSPVLIRRTAQTVDVTLLTLTRRQRPGALRANQCRASCLRTGLLVIEQIASSRCDLRQPTASQCAAALFADYFRPVTSQCINAPLAARVSGAQDSLSELLAAVGRERPALDAARALTGLCYLYMCDATNIAVCNDLIEEATCFAQRLSESNGAEELARMAARTARYGARLRSCAVTAQQLVSIVRSIARHLFGADPS